MPHIAVSLFPGRDENTKRDIAEKLQQFYVETSALMKKPFRFRSWKSPAKTSAKRSTNAIAQKICTSHRAPYRNGPNRGTG